MFRDKKLVVIMPAYNAAATLRRTYDEVLAQQIADEVLPRGLVDLFWQECPLWFRGTGHRLGLPTGQGPARQLASIPNGRSTRNIRTKRR